VRSIDEQSDVSHIETHTARDEYPIRQSWTFVIPRTPADQSVARKEG
jgi:hypothetical protein